MIEAMGDAVLESTPIRLLFVCGRNRWRSPTAEEIFAVDGVETQSAGVSPDADTLLDAEAIDWADVVFFMQPEHKRKAARQFKAALRGKRCVCLNIADKYAHMEPALVTLLRERVPRAVPRLCEADAVISFTKASSRTCIVRPSGDRERDRFECELR